MKTKYQKLSLTEAKNKLTNLEYEVAINCATEPPFTGKYYAFEEDGIYVDITTGEPLFSSLDKYPSSCGWPSFKDTISKNSVTYKADKSFGMTRTEVRSKIGDIHLGHLFLLDSESPNGTRYCINSASLRFIPYNKLKEEGYEEYLSLFEKEK